MTDNAGSTRSGKIDVGGHALFYRAMGEGVPAVVFECGLGATTEEWAIIQPEIARFARTISYDRAGLGFSDAAARPPDAHILARELHMLLEGAGFAPPYVLVGHSLGGVLIRMYTHLYPDDVAGLVFMDSSHPEQYERLPLPAYAALADPMMRMLPLMARLHINVSKLAVRYSKQMQDLPPDAKDRMIGLGESQKHLKALVREYQWHRQMFAQARMLGSLGDRPVEVVSAGTPKNRLVATVHELHRELTALSTRGHQRIVDPATHMSLATDRDHAMAMVAAIRDVWDQCHAEPAPPKKTPRRRKTDVDVPSGG